MSEANSARKPPGVTWERWVERQIRERMDQGGFDGLAGAGRPIADIDERRDEVAWIRRKLRDEGAAPPPPPAIQIRIEVDAALASLAGLESRAQVLALVEHLNERIRAVNRTVVSGPPTTVGPLPPEEVLARWERVRGGRDRVAEESPAPPDGC